MKCHVIDHTGALQCEATFHEIFHAEDGTPWASLTNSRNGLLFHATIERLRHQDGSEFERDLLPASRAVTNNEETSAALDEEFVQTVMEFLASGAKSIEHFHYMDKAHKRRINPQPAWFK